MLLYSTAAVLIIAVFVQGKPAESHAETKPATPIESTRNEIKTSGIAAGNAETPRDEIKASAIAGGNTETTRNEIKASAIAGGNTETTRNEIKASALTESRDRPFIKTEIIREISSAMDFLNNQIREFTERSKDKEDFKGIIEARNKLEAAIKPLNGVAESDMAATNLETAMTSSVNTAKMALDELTIKQVRQMERIAEEGKTKTVEEQERALREFADKHGENVKKAVDEVFDAKTKADVALENYLRSHSDTLSPEARKANDQMLFVMKDKKLNAEEKVKKLEEFVNTLPDFVRGELNVRDMREIKQLVQTHTGLTPVLHPGIGGGI